MKEESPGSYRMYDRALLLAVSADPLRLYWQQTPRPF
jgi:hypothetical protein